MNEMKKRVLLDKEKAKRNLEDILDKIHSGTDNSLLYEYNRLYRKEISLFKRSLTAAWLFMYYDQKETPAMRPKKLERRERAVTPSETSSLEEEDAKKLFISIGKNRRLFPREIITLIMSKTSSAREDIGAIKILDNYSFVQVRNTRADEIIGALNGIRFRGRTLTVNYAKPKAEE
jgi:RNA recognition motif-containing protein